MSKKDKGRLAPFVPLLIATIKTPAWLATSHGAKALYVSLKSHVPKERNEAFLSHRDAVKKSDPADAKSRSGFRNPSDTEILGALRPTLLTTKGPLIALSSPYARKGALWDTYKRHFGPDGDPHILVAKGATRDFNPEVSQADVDRAIERDPAKNCAEYLAEFRTDVEGFVTQEAVQACVSPGFASGSLSISIPMSRSLIRVGAVQTPSRLRSPTRKAIRKS